MSASPHTTGPSLPLIEIGLTLVTVALALSWPVAGSRVFQVSEHIFGKLARRRALAVLVVGLFACTLRLAILPTTPIPQPYIQDDFSYLLAAETVEVAPGSWISRVAYPELSDCDAEALVVEDALRLLERRRIEIIIRMVEQGSVPPRPRSPLGDCDPVWVARQAGLSDEIVALISSNGGNRDAFAPG